MLDPIINSIEVPCAQEAAFRIFVQEMDAWWPLAKFSVSALAGAAGKGLRVDARAGGRIVEIGHDGTEHHWGTIRGYDPFSAFSMDFHIAEPASAASFVEVRFTPLASGGTRVVLTQSNWEAFGDKAEMMRGGYGSGWSVIFMENYRAACGG